MTLLSKNGLAIILALLSTGLVTGCGGGSGSDNKEQQQKVDNKDESGTGTEEGEGTDNDDDTTTGTSNDADDKDENDDGEDNGTEDEEGQDDSEPLSDQDAKAKVLESVAEQIIIPRYQSFNDATSSLLEATTSLCEKSQVTELDLVAVKKEWLKTNLRWQWIRTTKFGPLADSYDYSRIQFWPTSNTLIVNGVETTLQDNYDFKLGFGDYKHQIQGLPAFEYLLFNQEQDTAFLTAENQPQRCQYMTAIAKNLVEISSRVTDKWQTSFKADFINGAGDFSNHQDVIDELFKYWFEYLESITDDKLNKPLGISAPGKVALIESGFAQVSLMNIEQNLQALYELYSANNDYGFDNYLIDVKQRIDVHNQIKVQFENVFSKLQPIKSKSLAELLETDESRNAIKEVVQSLDELRAVMSSDFVQIMEIQTGFNTNDGD
ncbi:imelysin family protein (plasmid) [Pseudoalteromonas sp. T1lg65]|uniref:imelysin family protein n=1 Tax=Pseudoalteromonas sp. T1lg65 TaxID=2077101 RepID=UPI003F78CECF